MFDFVRDGNKILDADEAVNHEAFLGTLKYFNRILDVMNFESGSDVPAEILDSQKNASKLVPTKTGAVQMKFAIF